MAAALEVPEDETRWSARRLAKKVKKPANRPSNESGIATDFSLNCRSQCLNRGLCL